jgi:SAM-dependent methyltransferase
MITPTQGILRDKLLLSAQEKLATHRKIWQTKPVLRRFYQEYFDRIKNMLPKGTNRIVEVGGGIGNLKSALPTVLSTDLVFCDWLDMVLDAEAMPFTRNSIDAFVGVDVLHHVKRPIVFFREAERCLVPGGRILLVDPYISPVSYIVFKLLHAERLSFSQDFFEEGKGYDPCGKDPWDANLALTTSLFWRQKGRFFKMFPGLEIVRLEAFDWTWPLSGGFGYPSLVPEQCQDWLIKIASWKKANSLAAFHAFVVIQKIA